MSSTSEQTATNPMYIVACPVSRCEVRHVAGVGVLMAFRYIERAEQFENGERTALQTLLDPEQALAIADALNKSVGLLEFGKTLKKSLRKSAKLLKASSSDAATIAAPVNA